MFGCFVRGLILSYLVVYGGNTFKAGVAYKMKQYKKNIYMQFTRNTSCEIKLNSCIPLLNYLEGRQLTLDGT